MNTKQLRQKILDLAIRGKLVPNESITNDEVRMTKSATLAKEDMPFEIPENWMWCRLGDIAQHNTGKTLDKKRNTGILREYITTSNLYWGYFDFTELRKMLIEDKELDRCTAIAGDLLICEGGDAGRSAIWKSEQSICFQNHIHRVRPVADISTNFLYYFMQCIYLNGEIKRYLKGIGIQSLSGNALASITVPIPPLSEQRRIVSVIESAFALIDEIEANKLSLAQLIKQTKSKVLDLAIRGKLVPHDPNDEPASALLRQIVKSTQKTQIKQKNTDKKISENQSNLCHKYAPFEIPESWEWCKILDISDLIQYGYTGSAIPTGKYKMLRITDIQNYSVDWKTVPFVEIDEKKAENYLLSNNDIVFARTGATVGKSFLIKNIKEKSVFASYLIRIQLKKKIYFRYVKYFFESEYYWEQIKDKSVGTGQPNVNGTLLGGIQIPLPPLSEQHRIVQKIETIFETLDVIQCNM